jgi:hypothetical protein
MANTEDFVVETGIEVSGSFNYSAGTISSGTVDLSTGCFFKETLTANTTYAFSNAKPMQIFQMEITGASDAVYTITWPSSVEWAYGISPPSPERNQKYIYTFITSDTGTSFIGGRSFG